jgi:hypothetical protein
MLPTERHTHPFVTPLFSGDLEEEEEEEEIAPEA